MEKRKDKLETVANKLGCYTGKKVSFDACTMFLEVIMTSKCCNLPMFP